MKKISKLLAVILVGILCAASLAACSSSGSGDATTAAPETTAATETTAAESKAEETTAAEAEGDVSGEIIVFAAASMTETLTEIKDLFEKEYPGTTVTYNFDSSGTLYTQITEGAACDVFVSASPKQMNQLDITADKEVNTDGNDYVLADTRVNLLENKVVLAVPEGNPKGIESFDQLAELLVEDGAVKLAMGNSDVPVGQYTQKIFAYYGIDEEAIANNLSYGTNVKEVTTQVSEATVDCGIVYATDAFSAGLDNVDAATKDMCGQVIYPAAVLNITENEAGARAFLEFIKGDEASAVFEAVGFTPLS